LLVVTLGATLLTRKVASRKPDWVIQTQTEDRTTSAVGTLRESAPLLSCVALGLGTALIFGARQTGDLLNSGLTNDRVFFVISGALAAVFVGGLLVSFVLSPFTRALAERSQEDLPSLKNAGTYIGWFERGLLFALILGGKPEAAAIALAAKSFARFPL
jgi:hypothetical protein